MVWVVPEVVGIGGGLMTTITAAVVVGVKVVAPAVVSGVVGAVAATQVGG